MNQELIDRYIAGRRSEYTLTWSITKDSDTYVVRAPNRASFTISRKNEWLASPSEQYQSTLLWLYSLDYLKLIAERFNDIPFCEEVLTDFHAFYFSPIAAARFETLTSRDHFAAEALKTLTYLWCAGNERTRVLSQELVEDLARWALEPDSIKANNHGMMLCMGILHADKFMHAAMPQRAAEIAAEQLTRILEGSFDGLGINIENSPAYHSFYVRYMEQIVQEIDSYSLLGDSHRQEVSELVAKAKLGLAAVVRPDGNLPPLGDGNSMPAVKSLPHQQGHIFSSATGTFVWKNWFMYFAFKCGMASVTHKHMDDNSLYLWSRGEELITDAGLYNYDWKDSMTVAVKSQRGHSGPYFTKYDDVYPATMYRADRVRVDANLQLIRCSENEFELEGVSTIDHTHTATRRVTADLPDSIVIQDSFTSPTQEERVARFLSPGEHSITISGHKVSIHGTTTVLTIESDVAPEIKRGLKRSTTPEAWRAIGFGEVEPCWVIEFFLSASENELRTKLTLTPRL